MDTVFNNAPPGDLVVTDTRFLNEIAAIHQREGVTVYIRRPGVGPRNDHPSETSVDWADFDHVVHNDGTLEDLYDKMTELVNSIEWS